MMEMQDFRQWALGLRCSIQSMCCSCIPRKAVACIQQQPCYGIILALGPETAPVINKDAADLNMCMHPGLEALR